MSEETGRTRFHYGFYAAMENEYDLLNIPLTYEQEVELGKDPVRIDFLVIKKDSDIVLDDPIGEFFKQVNIFEYKSPEDGLSIDDFYKVQAYGLFYKGFGHKVNELPIGNITLTIVRHTYPRDMLKMLRDSGIVVIETYPGNYRFEGKLSIPVQLVVSSQPPLGEYEGLRLLAKGATVEDIKAYAEKAIAIDNARIKENAGIVIDVCLSVNPNIEEATKMYEAVKKVFKDAFAKERQEGLQEGTERANERVVTNMLKKNFSLSLIEEISQLSEDAIRSIARNFDLPAVSSKCIKPNSYTANLH